MTEWPTACHYQVALKLRLPVLCVIFSFLGGATTLQKLSLAEMAEKATEVVHAKVGSCAPESSGPIVYTTCQLSVIERWKGAVRSEVRVSVPGGLRQTFAGAPTLTPGKEHVFFLWTGPSGRTQVIGLSQGLLSLERSSEGEWLVVRAPSRERMLDAQGHPVWDEGVDMPLAELRRTVTRGSIR